MQNRVNAGMYHADVPKLEDYGFVDYEPEIGQVTITPRTEMIVSMPELAEQLEGKDFVEYLEQAGEEPPQDTDRLRE